MSYYLTVFHPREELRQKVAGVEIEGKIRNTKKKKDKKEKENNKTKKERLEKVREVK